MKRCHVNNYNDNFKYLKDFLFDVLVVWSWLWSMLLVLLYSNHRIMYIDNKTWILKYVWFHIKYISLKYWIIHFCIYNIHSQMCHIDMILCWWCCYMTHYDYNCEYICWDVGFVVMIGAFVASFKIIYDSCIVWKLFIYDALSYDLW